MCVSNPRLSSSPPFLASDKFPVTSWSNLFLLSCIALHCESTGGKSVGYKADTFNWSNWSWVQLQKLDDPILRSNGSRRDSIQDSLVFQDRAQTCFSWHPEKSLCFYVCFQLTVQRKNAMCQGRQILDHRYHCWPICLAKVDKSEWVGGLIGSDGW